MNSTKQKNKTLTALSFVITLLVLYYKRPDAFTNCQFWGEEGSIFFADAYHQGFKSLFNTCAGYFHLYPRLVFCMALSSGVPLQFMPFVNCYAWLLVILLVVIYVWKRIGLEAYKKFFLVIFLTLIPIQAEVLMNLTNVQWIMALFPIIIFSCTNKAINKKWFWADAFVLFFTGFTGPNMLLLFPILFFVLLKKKESITTTQLILYGLIIVAAVACIYSLFTYGSISRTQGKFEILNPLFIDHIYLQYALLFLGKIAFDTPWILKCITVLFLFTYCIYIVYKILKGKVNNSFALVAFLSGILYLFTTLVSYRNNPAILHPHYGGARNFYLPALCCVWFFIFNLKPVQKPILVLSLLMLLFALENIRCTGRERFVDLIWNSYAKKMESSDTLSIPINPPGWKLFIDKHSRK